MKLQPKNEEACVLRLGRISAFAFIQTAKVVTNRRLKQVARSDTRGHDIFPFFLGGGKYEIEMYVTHV